MDIIIDSTTGTLVSGTFFGSSLQRGVGLNDVQTINVWLVKPTVPYDAVTPWATAEAGNLAWEVTLAQADGAGALVSGSALSAAASVAHPSGTWNGWPVTLEVVGTAVEAWLAGYGTRVGRLELTAVTPAGARRTFAFAMGVHNVASQIAAGVRRIEYAFEHVDLDVQADYFVPIRTGYDLYIVDAFRVIEGAAALVAGTAPDQVALGGSADGAALTIEYIDALQLDGGTRAATTVIVPAETVGPTITHLYLSVGKLAAGVTGRLATYVARGWEEPS